MTGRSAPIDLFTVTSRDFVPGTQVMLESFLQQNDWFDGRIVLLHDDLDETTQHDFGRLFAGLECRTPAPDLCERVDRLVAQFPKLSGRKRRFYSLDLFGGDTGAAALFIDSDMMFRGSVERALVSGARIAACGDRALLSGNTRDSESLAEVPVSREVSEFRSFNAGFMLVAPELRTSKAREAVLGHLDPVRWARISSDHTDQAVLNSCFGQEVHILDPTYNLMLGHVERIAVEHRIPAREAIGLHFNGPAKPWLLGEQVEAMSRNADYAFGLAQWHGAYRRFLARREAGPTG
ncbi:glycosyltransferase [Erythrobacter sp. HKB08]|uniref:glycosyltransferase family 8 protein n=1 Tax=Erythrobacter sp. HKB08 TaxID=2502843 RepID=UPI001008C5D6|nr:glycosyltransferase [Erythrobacter sp. HKB08]